MLRRPLSSRSPEPPSDSTVQQKPSSGLSSVQTSIHACLPRPSAFIRRRARKRPTGSPPPPPPRGGTGGAGAGARPPPPPRPQDPPLPPPKPPAVLAGRAPNARHVLRHEVDLRPPSP